MATRKDRHDARVQAVAGLGKVLSRRAGSRCELCEGDLDLRVVEIPPVDEEPSADAAILACGSCRERRDDKRPAREAEALRFLETAVWADPLPVKLAAIRWLRRLRDADVDWARSTLDGLWIDEAVAEALDA